MNVDSYLHLGILKDRFPRSLRYDSYLHLEATVDSIIRQGEWSIPAHIIPHVREIHNSLQDVSMDNNYEDKVIWKPSKDGNYTVRSTYHALRGHTPKLDWTSVVWFSGRIPRHSFIAWMAIRKSMRTRAKLFAWGSIDTALCILCQVENETETHLFGECSYSKVIWRELLQLMGFQRSILQWDEEVKWCCDNFKGKDIVSIIKKLTLCGFIYHVWVERNRRVHTAIELPPGQVLGLITTDVKLRAFSFDIKVKDSASNRSFMGRWNLNALFVNPVVKECSWVRPNSGSFILNTDGSLTQHTAGIGVIIRDEHGGVVVAAAGSVTPATITVHELQAVEAGLILASARGLRRIEVATDSTTVVHLLKHRDQRGPWHVVQLLRRIETLRELFDSVQFYHVFRETNRAADHLSKLLPTEQLVEIIESSFAEDMKKIVYEDRVGSIYFRL